MTGPFRGGGRRARGSRRAPRTRSRRFATNRAPVPGSLPRRTLGQMPSRARRRPHRLARARPRPTSTGGSSGPPSRPGRGSPSTKYRTSVRMNQGLGGRSGSCGQVGLLDSKPVRRPSRPGRPGGDVAQLGEHRVRIAGVRGSSPLISTNPSSGTLGPARSPAKVGVRAAAAWVGRAGGEPKGL
jgi:hypothetical protein